MKSKTKKELALYLVYNVCSILLIYYGTVLKIQTAFNFTIFFVSLEFVSSLSFLLSKKDFEYLKDKPHIKYEFLDDMFDGIKTVLLVAPGHFILACMVVFTWGVTEWSRNKVKP